MSAITETPPTAEELAAAAAAELKAAKLDPAFPFEVVPFDPDFFG